MPSHQTARFEIVGYEPGGNDFLDNIDTIGNTFLDQIDAQMVGWGSGPFVSRPAAGIAGRVFLVTDVLDGGAHGTFYADNGTSWDVISSRYTSGTLASRPAAGRAGRLYLATDDTTSTAHGTLYFDDGTAWDQVQIGPATSLALSLNAFLGLSDSSTRRGKSIIGTQESTTSGSFTLLTTNDKVASIVLPADGLIFVAYQAMWEESVTGSAQAAIFLGANQLQAGYPGVTNAGQYAFIGGSGMVNKFVPLSSRGDGLASNTNQNAFTTAYTGYATTGQSLTSSYIPDSAGNQQLAAGGPCCIFANAGTYDVSVRYAATAGGTVTVKNRKLWVWTTGF